MELGDFVKPSTSTQWLHCIKCRGDSGEYKLIYSVLKQIINEVYPFWYDKYLTKKDELQKRAIKFIDKINSDTILFILMRDEFFWNIRLFKK